ncbi:MAG: hypothetical protein ACRD7E_20650 [Bryobacteraceae bacterium]
MWSMWNAPSDREYYEPYGWEEEDQPEPEHCWHCGAGWRQACEKWCYTNAPASEPAPTEYTEPEPPPGVTVFQIESREFSERYRPYPSARHCYEFVYEEDGLRQLAALQKGRPPKMFRLVQGIGRTNYTQVECYCEDCGWMTGHYRWDVYERRTTVCSVCSWERYFSRNRTKNNKTTTSSSNSCALNHKVALREA